MIKHRLHRKIGEALRNNFHNQGLILDPACGGSQNIPLFLNDDRSNETEICNVDAAIIKDGKVKVIIEIEESTRTPTQICGKLLASILSKYYIHKNHEDIPKEIKDALFIQVLKVPKQKESKKKQQAANIRTAFENNKINSSTTSIKCYTLIWSDELGDECTVLNKEINNYLDT
ncbi:MAG: hypothetical protein ACUZ9M_04075 [Candidatus Scalindua sp.]